MAEQEEQVEAVACEDDDNDNPDYKAPAPKSLDEILGQDQEDESLRKYKSTILGEAGSGGKIIIEPDNPLDVIVRRLAICVENRPDIEIDLTQPREKIKESKIVLKEGCKYRVKLFFHVQREIVSGLRYEQKVFKSKLPGTVDKLKQMVGSYGPRTEIHEYLTPEEDAPSGMVARGDYKVESRFTDDDKNVYLEWEWHIQIKKDFD